MIKVITCHHYRHDCAELFYLGIERLKRDYHIQVFAAITNGDTKSIEIAEKYGAHWIECENKPLGRKWNNAAQLAWLYKGGDWLILGEDNLISKEAVEEKHSIINTVDGLKSCGVIDTTTGNVKSWTYKDDQQLIGAGRIFRQPQPLTIAKPVRPINVGNFQIDTGQKVIVSPNAEEGRNLTKLEKIYALWDDNLNSGLDRSSELTLGLLGYSPMQFDNGRLHVLDFKTVSNIHPFNEFGGCKEYDGDWKWFLSVEEKDYIAEKWNL